MGDANFYMGCGLMWEPGLPAMQAPRFISDTEVMQSQASQLPHKDAPWRAAIYSHYRGGEA
ncbi:hypothetical protein FW800_03175 [Pseudomonas sp. 910_23]|uniref:Uncharacterized protein n=1 Tax=Pseudomonas synxantha TaxID=47883 RepID=A0A5D3GFZ7_9PSED|nr:hypothetical protein [Pseudomonas sp. W2Aug9]MCK3829598.1 hypothetical protein [Pseudomonas fluorescens]MCK3840824.1 hypothetical protein [Pseudomonas sp. NCIMB 10586]MCK3845752.1 hypothetical protein [Pseudomonas sp. W15Feb34]MCK3851934.1 hypothetical protein [Pseudomonas sp. W2Jun17]MCK3866184.1 hypothetical protein [Pseudomonas sp. B329]TYK58305.1 hypothetical protein FXO26_09835 [Pseudomonas synxantha]